MTDEELTEALDLLDRLTEGLLPLSGPFQVYRERVDTWKKMMRDKLAPLVPTAPKDFDNWMREGIEAGYCGPPVCDTHDGTPMSEAEDQQFGEGDDICIHVVRLYEDAQTKAEVEASHSPSVWRNTYSRKDTE